MPSISSERTLNGKVGKRLVDLGQDCSRALLSKVVSSVQGSFKDSSRHISLAGLFHPQMTRQYQSYKLGWLHTQTSLLFDQVVRFGWPSCWRQSRICGLVVNNVSQSLNTSKTLRYIESMICGGKKSDTLSERTYFKRKG